MYRAVAFKWDVLVSFVEHYGLGTRKTATSATPNGNGANAPVLDLWLVKRASRVTGFLTEDPKNDKPEDDQTTTQRFSHLLNKEMADHHIMAICASIAGQVPEMRMSAEMWTDDRDILDFARYLHQVAVENNWIGNDLSAADKFAEVLRRIIVQRQVFVRFPQGPEGARLIEMVGGSRGWSTGKQSKDAKTFSIGDKVLIEINPPKEAFGKYDFYIFESWTRDNPAKGHTSTPFPWNSTYRLDIAIFESLPFITGQEIKDETAEKRSVLIKEDTIRQNSQFGLHELYVIGFLQPASKEDFKSSVWGRIQTVIANYRAVAAPTNRENFDLNTHMLIMRELRFHISKLKPKKDKPTGPLETFLGYSAYTIAKS